MCQKIKIIFFDVVGDFKSSIYHAYDLLIHSSTKRVTIFFVIFLAFTFATIFNSRNQAEFYISFSQGILTVIAIYFIVCLSDYFWFLIRRKSCYKLFIRRKKQLNLLFNKIKDQDAPIINEDFGEAITKEVNFISNGYKYHATRYVIEILAITILMSYLIPDFYFFSLIIFGGLFFIIFLHEKQSADQAFDVIIVLTQILMQFNKLHPKKCKRFIMENESEEIKELQKLYKIVSEI